MFKKLQIKDMNLRQAHRVVPNSNKASDYLFGQYIKFLNKENNFAWKCRLNMHTPFSKFVDLSTNYLYELLGNYTWSPKLFVQNSTICTQMIITYEKCIIKL